MRIRASDEWRVRVGSFDAKMTEGDVQLLHGICDRGEVVASADEEGSSEDVDSVDVLFDGESAAHSVQSVVGRGV